MIKLTNKDADFLAGIFREFLADNEKAWQKLEDTNHNIEELARMTFRNDETINEKLNELKEAKHKARDVYIKRVNDYTKALELCMVGSDEA